MQRRRIVLCLFLRGPVLGALQGSLWLIICILKDHNSRGTVMPASPSKLVNKEYLSIK